MDIRSVLNMKNSSVHFIGIGGVSMSSLAKLLKADGHIISGSDMNYSDNVKKLEKLGIDIYVGHSENNIKNCDMVVYTAAVKEDNPELIKARKLNILTVERCDLLGEIMRGYKYPVNISGTHGKTTTTSMVASVFLEGGLNPTVSIGGDYEKIGGNLNIGDKVYFICEACEYVDSFLKFFPYYTIILNIEPDHLDYFKDIEHIKSSFLKFTDKTAEDGVVILNGDDKECVEIKDLIKRKVYTFGLSKENDIYADNITFPDGFASFDVYLSGEFMGNIRLTVPGEHNILNALSVIMCAHLSGISFENIKKGLNDFSGAKRRFEYKGCYNGAEIYDDYAHHPSEIETTIKSVKTKPHKNSYIIFQPHTYTRTLALKDEFIEVLKKAENVIVADIYAAREKNTSGITSEILSDNIPNAYYFKSFEEIEDYLKTVLTENDIVVTVGAGDVYKIGESLIKSADTNAEGK